MKIAYYSFEISFGIYWQNSLFALKICYWQVKTHLTISSAWSKISFRILWQISLFALKICYWQVETNLTMPFVWSNSLWDFKKTLLLWNCEAPALKLIYFLWFQDSLLNNWTAAAMYIQTLVNQVLIGHDDVIKWKHFPRYWPFVRGIHRSPVNSPRKGQWRGALICGEETVE